MELEEIWRPVELYNIRNSDGGYRYEVSNLGNVRATSTVQSDGSVRKAHMLKQDFSQTYARVSLQIGKACTRKIAVHRLVALAFILNPYEKSIVVHKDGDVRNNRVDNLKWVARVAVVVKEAVTEHSGISVCQDTTDGEFIAEYKSANSAARAVHLAGASQILKCCRKESGFQTAAGYRWSFGKVDAFRG